MKKKRGPRFLCCCRLESDDELDKTAGRKIPSDVIDALKNCFSNISEADTLARIIYFLTKESAAGPYLESLQVLIGMPGSFKILAEQYAEYTKSDNYDTGFRKTMHDACDVLKNKPSPSSSDGRELALAIPRNTENTVGLFAFVRAVSQLSPESYNAIHQVAKNLSGPLVPFMEKALSTTRSAKPGAGVAILMVPLAINTIQDIGRWWRGEITGIKCVNNIAAIGVGVAAGLGGMFGGKMIGAAIGAAAGGPVGMLVGALTGGVIGGVGASKAATVLCDMLMQWIFGLPKTEALEKAYKFLGVSQKASNSEINSRYRKLSLKYHPNKGGNGDDWTRLLYSLAIIREARGEA